MTPADYAEAIEKALEAGATDGPWSAAGPSFGDPLPRYCNEVLIDNEGSDDDGETVCRPPIDMDTESTADMVYIAACHPAALRSLLDEREALTGEVERLRKDSALLDHLQSQGLAYGTHEHEGNEWRVYGAYANVRDAIHADMLACQSAALKDTK